MCVIPSVPARAGDRPFPAVGEALRDVQDHLDSRNFYAFNPAFDKVSTQNIQNVRQHSK